jgi:hypothetical protein
MGRIRCAEQREWQRFLECAIFPSRARTLLVRALRRQEDLSRDLRRTKVPAENGGNLFLP